MKSINSTRPQTAATDRTSGPSGKSDDAPARRPTPRHIADAVIASYIHDISQASHRGSGRRARRQLMAQPV
jgi:hypothetical protein